MYLRELNQKQLGEIIELERELTGSNSFSEEEYVSILSSKYNFSYGAYKDKKLIAFIIAYSEAFEENKLTGIDNDLIDNSLKCIVIKISLFKSKKSLFLLMMMFPVYALKEGFSIIKINTNSKILKLCLKMKERINPVVTSIDVDRKHESLNININLNHKYFWNVIDNIKYRIIQQIYYSTNCCSSLNSIFHNFVYSPICVSESTDAVNILVKYKKVILRMINNRNLDFLNMLGDKYPVLVKHSVRIYNESLENFTKKLEEHGYASKSTDDLYNSNISTAQNLDRTYFVIQSNIKYHPIIEWYNYVILDNKYYNNTLSYFRHILKKHIIEYWGSLKFTECMHLFNKYGDEMFCLCPGDDVYRTIPRTYANLFDSYIYKDRFIKKIINIGINEYGLDKDQTTNSLMFSALVKIRKTVGEDSSIDFAKKIFQKSIAEGVDYWQVIHDWYYLVDEMFSDLTRNFLTKKAYKTLIHRSLTKIKLIHDKIKGLNMEYIDIKKLRKSISKNIIKDLPIDDIIDAAVRESIKTWLIKKHISYTLQDQLNKFVMRMSKYCNGINVPVLFNIFKRNTIKMVKGTYKGLFEETYYEMDKNDFGNFIRRCLGSRNTAGLAKKPRRLFSALNKIASVPNIVEGNIDSSCIEQILKEIHQRNISIPEDIAMIDKFSAKIEKKCSPEFLVAGDASVCCMSFGTEKAVDYALEKGFGIFNVYYKNKVIANSVIWINETYNCLVLDNIEVNLNYIKFNNYIKKLYFKMISNIMGKYLLAFTIQGCRYNDLKLFCDEDPTLRLKKMIPVEVNKATDFYSDAERSYLIALNDDISLNESAVGMINSSSKSAISYDVEEDVLPF